MDTSYKRLLAYLGIFAGTGGLLIWMVNIWSSAPTMGLTATTAAIAGATAAVAYALIKEIGKWK